jgi:hypothetical protein
MPEQDVHRFASCYSYKYNTSFSILSYQSVSIDDGLSRWDRHTENGPTLLLQNHHGVLLLESMQRTCMRVCRRQVPSIGSTVKNCEQVDTGNLCRLDENHS